MAWALGDQQMELDDEHGRPLTGWGPGHMCVSRNRISRRTSLYCGPETTTTTSQTRRGYIRRRPGPFTECVRRDFARLSITIGRPGDARSPRGPSPLCGRDGIRSWCGWRLWPHRREPLWGNDSPRVLEIHDRSNVNGR